jgi:hypothetical protein
MVSVSRRCCSRASNSLDKAQHIFERFVTKRPRVRLTIRQRTRVLKEWPRS